MVGSVVKPSAGQDGHRAQAVVSNAGQLQPRSIATNMDADQCAVLETCLAERPISIAPVKLVV